MVSSSGRDGASHSSSSSFPLWSIAIIVVGFLLLAFLLAWLVAFCRPEGYPLPPPPKPTDMNFDSSTGDRKEERSGSAARAEISMQPVSMQPLASQSVLFPKWYQ